MLLGIAGTGWARWMEKHESKKSVENIIIFTDKCGRASTFFSKGMMRALSPIMLQSFVLNHRHVTTTTSSTSTATLY